MWAAAVLLGTHSSAAPWPAARSSRLPARPTHESVAIAIPDIAYAIPGSRGRRASHAADRCFESQRPRLPLLPQSSAARVSHGRHWDSRITPRHAFRCPVTPVSRLKWVQILSLLVLQLRFLPFLWKFLSTQRLRIVEAEDLCVLQEAFDNGKLARSVKISHHELPVGTEIAIPAETLTEAQLPLRVAYRLPIRWWAQQSGWRFQLRELLGAISRIEEPALFWGWTQLGIETVMQIARRFFTGELSRHTIRHMSILAAKFSRITSFTALAWLVTLLISWGTDLRSRGPAVSLDVLGSQSSLREARVNALSVLLQVIVWVLWAGSVLWAAGIDTNRILLFPSVTAVVIGWVAREIVANVMSGVVIHLTQPFAQGDWVTLEDGALDGWVQAIGVFHTRVVQWDKRPMYVPNFKIMTMNVQNNSRMTHRRIMFKLPLRLRDIPKIPTIVQEIQEMINDHEDVDPVQHRIVRWRFIGDCSADIWLSCYTRPTLDGIRLNPWTAIQQSILERASGIVYKNGAQFASTTDRYPQGEWSSPLAESPFPPEVSDERESQLQSREEVLRQQERELKEKERDMNSNLAQQKRKEKNIADAAEKYKRLLQSAVLRQEADQGANEPTLASPLESVKLHQSDSLPDEEDNGIEEQPSHAAAESSRFEDLENTLAIAEATLEGLDTPISEGLSNEPDNSNVLQDSLDSPDTVDKEDGLAPSRSEDSEGVSGVLPSEPDLEQDANAVHSGEVLHVTEAETTRIPVKEMGD